MQVTHLLLLSIFLCAPHGIKSEFIARIIIQPEQACGYDVFQFSPAIKGTYALQLHLRAKPHLLLDG